MRFTVLSSAAIFFLGTSLWASDVSTVETGTSVELDRFSMTSCESLLSQPEATMIEGQVAGGEATEASRRDLKEMSRWFYSPVRPLRGVAVVVHGLNMRPSKMGPIIDILNGSGIDVYRVTLTGHSGSLDEFRKVTRLDWLRDEFRSYCIAAERAQRTKLPLYYVGFSLGGLLNQDLLNLPRKQKVAYERQVLFAPALALMKYSPMMIRFFSMFGGQLTLPSFTPESLRAYWGAPVAGYQALFDSLVSLEKTGWQRSNIPTVVFAEPDDELVNFTGLKELVQQQKLDRWDLVTVKADGTLDGSNFRHLIVAPEMLGPEQWNTVRDRIRLHLLRSPAVAEAVAKAR